MQFYKQLAQATYLCNYYVVFRPEYLLYSSATGVSP